MRLVAISVLAWLTGFAAYVGGLAIFWGETLGGADLIAVLYWSVLASTVAIAVVYAPAMFALRGVTRGRAKGWTYALALRSLGSPEAILFYFMFGAFGFVFGHGFFVAYGRRSSLGRITFEP